MYKIIDYSDYDAGVKEIVVDTLAEMYNVPCGMGSQAFCFEDKKFYIKDSNENWIPIA